MLRLIAFGLAAAALAANLLTQPPLMHLPPAVILSGLLDFHPVWNHGVSFGLFTQDSDTGRTLLITALTVLSAGVAVAAWRLSVTRFSAVAYGVLLGGALGNLVDRIRFHGAVFDYLYLHLGALPLFVCNFSDIAISAGFVLLLLDSLLAERRKGAA